MQSYAAGHATCGVHGLERRAVTGRQKLRWLLSTKVRGSPGMTVEAP
jgi:hypothetical protein